MRLIGLFKDQFQETNKFGSITGDMAFVQTSHNLLILEQLTEKSWPLEGRDLPW
jgi:hypothetical protein